MLPFRIALRYLFSKKTHGAVNVISAISLTGVAVAATAMIIVLSVFNGFSGLVEQKMVNFDPDLLVVPAQGKTIAYADSVAASLRTIQGIRSAEPALTEQAFAIAGEQQMPVTLRGMTGVGLQESGISGITIDGKCEIADHTAIRYASALLSVGVAMSLNIRPANAEPLALFEPRRIGRINPANPIGAFLTDTIRPVGVYQVQQEEYDRDMVIIPLEMARRLLDYTTEASEIAIYLDNPDNTEKTKELIADKLNGSDKPTDARLNATTPPYRFIVKNRMEQQEEAFRMISIEKWITFLMLAFILAIASFNIISTLSMLIIEKENNMAILTAMGGTGRFIKQIFISQGWLITITGGIGGIISGSLLVIGQQHFGWIRLSASDPSLMAVDTYPVELQLTDIIICLAAVAAVAIIISLFVVAIMRRRNANDPADKLR